MAEYIERESIKKSINSLLDMVLKFTHSPIEIKQLVFDVIDEERATVVQPVKHGRWELTNNPSFRKCSECDAWWSSDITDNCFTNYCPKCGTRMIKDGDTNG